MSFKEGSIPWNRGLKGFMKGRKNTQETKEKIRLALIGNKNTLGIRWSEKRRQKFITTWKKKLAAGFCCSYSTRLKMRNSRRIGLMNGSIKVWNKGKPLEYVTQRNLRDNPGRYVRNPSKPQLKLYNYLKSLLPHCTVKLNYPVQKKIKGFYYLDMVVLEFKMNWEYDEPYWHKNKKKDNERDDYLESLGWNVWRFTRGEIACKSLGL